MSKLKAVLVFSVCALALSAVTPAQINPLIESAYARGGGGHGGGNGGGHGGGHGGASGNGHGAGIGGGHGLAGTGHGLGHGVGDGHGLGQGKGHGAATSATARSDETSGLAKAMAVVATTPAAIAGALGLDKAFSAHDDADVDGRPGPAIHTPERDPHRLD